MRIFYTVLILLYSGMSLAAYSPDNSMIEANIYSVDFNTTNQRSVVKVSLFDENNRPFYAGDCSDVSIERKAGEDAAIGELVLEFMWPTKRTTMTVVMPIFTWKQCGR